MYVVVIVTSIKSFTNTTYHPVVYQLANKCTVSSTLSIGYLIHPGLFRSLAFQALEKTHSLVKSILFVVARFVYVSVVVRCLFVPQHSPKITKGHFTYTKKSFRDISEKFSLKVTSDVV